MSPPNSTTSPSPTSASTASSACTFPCTSYSAATRKLLRDLDEDPPALPYRARAHDRAQRARDPALAADHLADIVGRDVQHEHECVLALLRLHAHRVGLVDQLAREVREQLGHYFSMPLTLSSRATGSVGCAPF